MDQETGENRPGKELHEVGLILTCSLPSVITGGRIVNLPSALQAFDMLVDAHGGEFTRSAPNTGTETPGVVGTWFENDIQREYTERGIRTVRTGVLTIRDCAAPAWEFGEQWTVEGVLWQVSAMPHTEQGLRIYNLRRDEKVLTAGSRGERVI